MALFTHSYYRKGGAELNPVTDYFEDAVIVKATKSGIGSGASDEYRHYKSNGYVFCQWVNVFKDLMLLVKPPLSVEQLVQEKFGYPTDSIRVMPARRVVWTSAGGFRMEAIAGDLDINDFKQFVKDRLVGANNQYADFWVLIKESDDE